MSIRIKTPAFATEMLPRPTWTSSTPVLNLAPQQLYLTDFDVADRYRVNRLTIWRWVKTAGLPKPIKLSPGCSRWELAALLAWEEGKRKD